ALRGYCAACHQHGHLESDQLLHQYVEALDPAAGVAGFECDRTAVDVAELPHLLPEGAPPLQPLAGVEQSDDGRLGGRLLRIGPKRCGAKSEQSKYCIATVHSMTRSARN